jgi:hypothetical protein
MILNWKIRSSIFYIEKAVREWDYTDKERNMYWLYKYVNYDWVPLKIK